MKHKKWIALMTAVLVFSGMSVTAFAAESTEPEAAVSAEESTGKTGRHGHVRKDRTAEPENAIGKDAAKEATLADAGVSAEDAGKVRSRLSRTEDGTVVYRVSFTSGELWYCYRIDAVTGGIVEKTTEDAAEHKAARAERADRSGKSAECSEDGNGDSGRGHRHGSRRDSVSEESQSEA